MAMSPKDLTHWHLTRELPPWEAAINEQLKQAELTYEGGKTYYTWRITDKDLKKLLAKVAPINDQDFEIVLYRYKVIGWKIERIWSNGKFVYVFSN